MSSAVLISLFQPSGSVLAGLVQEMRNRSLIIQCLVMVSCTYIIISFIPKQRNKPEVHHDEGQAWEFKEEKKEMAAPAPAPEPPAPAPKAEELKKIQYHPRNVLRTFTKREKCEPTHGSIVIFVMYRNDSLHKGYYGVALGSLQCYLKGRNYKLVMVDIDKDERIQKACSKHQQLFFKKHCAAAEYLKDGDWMLVLDADTGIVNPHHCIEEWIDDRVDLVFYERFFNWEIASGNYLARNTKFAFDFLIKWADWEYHQPSNWNGADNGVLQIHILQTVLPDAKQEAENCNTFWLNGTDYDTYMAYVLCVKLALGGTRIWPGKLRIYRRAHGWVRDGYMTTDQWGPSDFMLHGWKSSIVGDKGWESPFKHNINVSLCGEGDEGWPWRENKMLTDEQIKKQLADFERSTGNNFPKQGRVFPHLQLPDVGKCYPFCENGTDLIGF